MAQDQNAKTWQL